MVSSSPNSPEMRVDSSEMSKLMVIAVLISALGGIIVMMMAPSSSKGGASLDAKFFLSLSKEIGKKWKHLAICLDFSDAQIETFVADNIGNSQEQCRQMLVDWRRKQTDEEEAREKLRQALVDIDRQDLALKVSGECGPRKKATSGKPAQDAADRCQQALKSWYTTTGSFVPMIPWINDDKTHIMDMYTKLKLAKDTCDVQGKVDVYDDIFLVKTKQGHPVKRVIFSGLPGVGKSTLIDKIAYDWADRQSEPLRKYKLVFVLKMHKLEQNSDLINAVFDQLLAQDTAIDQSNLKSYIDNNQDKVLILLDGFDEFMTTNLDESKFGSILKILNRKIGAEIDVLITTRPSHYSTLVSKSLIQRPICHVKVLGFSEKDINQYIDKFFSGEADKGNRLLERIKFSKVLSDVAKSPMLLLFMCLLWREDSTLPDTMSRLYSKAVEYIFRRKKVTDGITDIVVAIGEVALDGLLSPDQRLSFQEGEFEKSVLDKALKAGILTSQRVMKGLDPANNVHFIHKAFQEFCAAKHCHNVMEKDFGKFQKILDQITNPELVEHFLQFCCGDSEPCTNAILKMLHVLKKREEDIVDVSLLKAAWLNLTLLCYFESQTEKLPPVDVVNTVLVPKLSIEDFNSDQLTSLCYFLKSVAHQSEGKVNNYLARVRCIEIKECDLWRCGDLFLQFKQMPNLHTLTCLIGIAPCGVSSKLDCQKVLSSLQKLEQLREFKLCKCTFTGEDLKHISKSMPNLVELNLSHNKFSGGSFSLLKEMKHLQRLNLSFCTLRGKDLKHISTSMPNLVELDLSQSMFLGGSFSHFKEMKHLQMLTLSYCKLTGKGLKHIAESMPNLVELDLSLVKISGGSWSHLKEMNCLQKLNLGNCKLTGKDLKHMAKSLSKMPNLVELDLSWNEALRGSFSHLKKMKHLQKLNLQCNGWTGEYMEQFAELLSKMPNLVELKLSDTWSLGGLYLYTLIFYVKEMEYLQKLHLSECSLTEAVKAQLAALRVEVTLNPL